MSGTVLTMLYDAVVARFAAELAEADRPNQTFGWLAPAEQMQGTQRIVWTPGDPGGSLGAHLAVKFPGKFPRTLGTLEELCTVEITALDDTAPNDERRQYEAARTLFDAWWRAVYLEAIAKGIGPVRVASETWAGGDRGRRMGQTIRVVFGVQSPIVDVPLAAEPVLADRAVIAVQQHDVTETLTVNREE